MKFIRVVSPILLLFAAMTSDIANATSLSPEQALSRIKSLQPSQLKKAGMDASVKALKLVDKVSSEKEDGIYVFATDGGRFVIAPATDRAPAILGYGVNFDAGNIPPAMKWWMEMSEANIEAGEMKVAAPADATTVSPLMSTTWDQGTPYNDLCPKLGGRTTYTGCVATSTSQVVNYHRFPEGYGIGSHSYYWNGNSIKWDYATTRFDWADMLDSYTDGNYTEAQASAVATLMKATGVGVDMTYGTAASGALSLCIPYYLRDNLGYNPGVGYMLREYFTQQQWERMICDELMEGRPVIYGGQSEEGGHSFVCDGYDGNGYFHINWGWSGVSDGWFLLSALNPDTQGAGGSGNNSGFNSAQDIVKGICPPDDTHTATFLPLYTYGSLAYDPSKYRLWYGTSGYIYNYSPVATDFIAALELDGTDGTKYYGESNPINVSGVSNNYIKGTDGFSVIFPQDIPAGKYTATAVARNFDNKIYQQIYVKTGCTNSVNLAVGENHLVTFDGTDPDEVKGWITVASIASRNGADIASGSAAYMMVKYENNGSAEAANPIDFRFENVKTGDVYTYGSYNVSLAAGGTRNTAIKQTFGMPDGKYSVRAVNRLYSVYASEPFDFYIGVKPTAVSLDQQLLTLEEGTTSTLTATVVPANAFDTAVTWSTSDADVATVDASGNVSAIEEGEATITATTINGLTAQAVIKVVKNSGIEVVNGDSNAKVTYYNLQGILVEQPSEGQLYIVKQGNTVSKMVYRD